MEETRLPMRKRRRDSLGRTLDRIRLAMRRSSGTTAAGAMTLPEEVSTSSHAIPESSIHPDQMVEQSISPRNATGISSADGPRSFSDTNRNATHSNNADVTASSLPLIIDTGGPIEVGDSNDPIPPFTASMDAFKSVRARGLFEKYGIQYEEGTRQRSDGRSHIDRSIRIRLHWDCHKCNTAFGRTTSCATCGHERCAECPRSPLKRVREFLGDTSIMKQIDDQAAKASADKDTVLLPVAIGADALLPTDPPTESTTKAALPTDLAVRDVTADTNIDLMHIQHANRRTAAMGPQLHPRPNGDRVRCTCHECGVYFTRVQTHKCQNCGHGRCSACPFIPETTESPFPHAVQDLDPPLRRVYRKPRQRVRWSCHQCQATFLAFRNCGNCGHERCGLCIRSPYVLSTFYHFTT